MEKGAESWGLFTRGKWKIHTELMKDFNVCYPAQPLTLPLLITSHTQGQIWKEIKTSLWPYVFLLASVTACVVSVPLLHHTGRSRGTISVSLAAVWFRGLLTRVRGTDILRLHTQQMLQYTQSCCMPGMIFCGGSRPILSLLLGKLLFVYLNHHLEIILLSRFISFITKSVDFKGIIRAN